MSVSPVSLKRRNLVLVHDEEISDLTRWRDDGQALGAVAIELDHAAIALRIGDIEMIITPACGEHIVGKQQINGLLGGCCPIEHQAYGHRRRDDGLAGDAEGGLAVEREHRAGNALLVHAV